jgi:adenosylhomocysteine nucleosidase
MRRPSFAGILIACLGFLATLPAEAADTLDPLPRTAVMSAFQPEWAVLQAGLQDRHEYAVNGNVFDTGTIAGKPVVLVLSGVSMVNAAMTAQLLVDRFNIDRIVFSGIAGGVDPALRIGDVVVPTAWREYLEAVFARETKAGYQLPPFETKTETHFGMIFPQPVQILRGHETPEERTWFPVDPQLLAIAKAAGQAVTLKRCVAPGKCLSDQPKVLVGGTGVSGQAFVDNAAFRAYARKSFDAEAIDMESAAVAHVAYADGIPFIAFRSLSDLAGGDADQNAMGTFFQLASDNSAAVVIAFLKRVP